MGVWPDITVEPFTLIPEHMSSCGWCEACKTTDEQCVNGELVPTVYVSRIHTRLTDDWDAATAMAAVTISQDEYRELGGGSRLSDRALDFIKERIDAAVADLKEFITTSLKEDK